MRTQSLTLNDTVFARVVERLGYSPRTAEQADYHRRVSERAEFLRRVGRTDAPEYHTLLTGRIPGEEEPAGPARDESLVAWLDARDMVTEPDPGPGPASGEWDLRTNGAGWPVSRLGKVGRHWYRLRVDYGGRCPSGPCGQRLALHRIHPPETAALAAELDAALTF